MITQYTAKDGTVYTDEDIEKWAEDAENGFPGVSFGPSVPGRPVSVGTDAKPFTLRLGVFPFLWIWVML